MTVVADRNLLFGIVALQLDFITRESLIVAMNAWVLEKTKPLDGNDDVWLGNFWGKGVVRMAGDGAKGHPVGTKTGDAIHQFQSGSIQLITDVGVDLAGNVWAANNWNDVDAIVAPNPIRRTSTWGGGSGLTIIYGVAAPVKTPLLGPMRQP